MNQNLNIARLAALTWTSTLAAACLAYSGWLVYLEFSRYGWLVVTGILTWVAGMYLTCAGDD